MLGCLFVFSCNSQSIKSIDSNQKENTVVEVAMLKYQFVPQSLTIKVGQTVRWINKEKRQYHSVWFEKYGEKESDYLFPGDTFEKTFLKVGTFDYRCGPHPEMVATIVVE